MGTLFGQVIKALGSGARVFEYMSRQPKISLLGGEMLLDLKGKIWLFF
jgi:hypothetical protein